MTQLTEQDIDRLARKRAKAKMGWFIHATVYLCVNGGLILMWLFQDRPLRWAGALGWGLGLMLHGISVWFLQPGNGLIERMVERERQNISKRQ